MKTQDKKYLGLVFQAKSLLSDVEDIGLISRKIKQVNSLPEFVIIAEYVKIEKMVSGRSWEGIK